MTRLQAATYANGHDTKIINSNIIVCSLTREYQTTEQAAGWKNVKGWRRIKIQALKLTDDSSGLKQNAMIDKIIEIIKGEMK